MAKRHNDFVPERLRLSNESRYPRVVEQLDLEAALAQVTPNDFLPPRPDDKAGGHAAKRFLAALRHSLSTGDYQPDPAVMVPVAKWKYATRPVALMGLADRVVYHALVEPLRQRIEEGLVSDRVLYWPRGTATAGCWREFVPVPLDASGAYIVRADIAGFFESVDHHVLHQLLVTLTGNVEVVDALLDFLGQVMSAPRGLPQGVDAGNALGAAYLSSVDAEMCRVVRHYWRYSDDILMTVPSRDAGRHAVNLLEQQLRGVRLLLHAEKTGVLRRETYLRRMSAVDEHLSVVRRTLAGQVCPHREPAEVEVAAAAYEQAVAKALGADPEDALTDNALRDILDATLLVLRAEKHPHPMTSAVNVIGLFPEKTRVMSEYLREIASSYPVDVAKIATDALTSQCLAGSQKAFLLSVLRGVFDSGGTVQRNRAVHMASGIAESDDEAWLARVEAARLLAQAGSLEHRLLRHMWSRVPAALRADLVAAVAAAARNANGTWAVGCRDALSSDPVAQVVLRAVEAGSGR